MYRQALTIEPDNALALNALGTLKAVAGHNSEAEKYYRQALRSDPTLVAARHDLAVLLADEGKRSDEAIALWNDNLAREPNHLPSRLGLARTLAQLNRPMSRRRNRKRSFSAAGERGRAAGVGRRVREGR
jgi:predicted Zn-dependent protease